MKINSTQKEGISLIVLIITIIVMIILAGAIILTLNNNGVIDRANEAVEKSDDAALMEAANIAYSEWILDKQMGTEVGTAEEYVKQKLNEQGLDGSRVEISEDGKITIKSLNEIKEDLSGLSISYDKAWTNQNITVTLSTNTGRGIEYKTSNQTNWIQYTTPISISENGTLQYKYTDSNTYKEETIQNIDKLNPAQGLTCDFYYFDNIGNATVELSGELSDATATDKYGSSGTKEVYVQFEDLEWEKLNSIEGNCRYANQYSGSFTIGNTYTFRYKIIDNAGNEVVLSGDKQCTDHMGGIIGS